MYGWGCVCLLPLCVCILALDPDIGGFEARSMGHGVCLNVYYLRLGPIDHFREGERVQEREPRSVERNNIKCSYGGSKGQCSEIFSHSGTYSICRKKQYQVKTIRYVKASE